MKKKISKNSIKKTVKNRRKKGLKLSQMQQHNKVELNSKNELNIIRYHN